MLADAWGVYLLWCPGEWSLCATCDGWLVDKVKDGITGLEGPWSWVRTRAMLPPRSYPPPAMLIKARREAKMNPIRTIGLTLLASLAVSIVASASASATLGLFKCEPGIGNSSLGANCLAETGGTFTVKAATGARSTSKAGGETILAVGAKEIRCTAATSEGEVTSLTEGRGTIKFTGCAESPGGISCESPGAGAKEIVVPVSSKIVPYIEATTLKAGLLLGPRNSRGENKLELECSGIKVKVYGSLIGSVAPEDEMSLGITSKWVVNGGVQAIPETTNSLRAKFGSGATEKASEEGEALHGFASKVEVMG